jgi:hypothetical protein
MIRRSPCETYLKYLITHPDEYEDEVIRKIIQLHQLDFIGFPYLERLRSVCVAPTPFYPEDRKHRPSQRFLQKEKIETIYHQDDAMKGAIYILEHPKAKEVTEMMLITRSDPSWVSLALKRKGFNVTPEAVKRYKHYYFDVELVDAPELETLLLSRGKSDDTKDRDEQTLAANYARANKGDPRVLTARMTIQPLAELMNVIRMGVLPSNVELSRLAKAARASALIGVAESTSRLQPERGRDFALVAKMMSEVVEQIGDTEIDLKSGLASMILETEEASVPHIKELSDGSSHTLDVQPLEGRELDAGKPKEPS